MKNSIMSFLLGVFVTISIASTSVVSNLMTVKPAVPRYTITYVGTAPAPFIKKHVKEGFIVDKTGVIPNYSEILVVMVKY